ncbi:MAG TPA: alpha/beta hydrolase [bacterium]|nr:alpha/beta hydrolase [bacterium]
MVQHFSPTPGVTLAYTVTGTGPGLVCLPGLGAGRDSFRDVEVACRDRRTVLRFDPRGIGESSATGDMATAFEWPDLAADAETLIAHVAAAHPDFLPCDLVGMSFGGVLAQLLAYRQPTLVRHLTLVSTSHRKTPYGVRSNGLIQLLVDRTPPDVFGETIGLLLFSPDFLDSNPGLKGLRQDAVTMPERPDGRPEPGGAGCEGRYRPAFRRMAALGGTMPEAFDHLFPLPPSQVTAVVGTQDQIVSPQGRASVLELAGEQVVLEGAGHVIGELARLISERL